MPIVETHGPADGKPYVLVHSSPGSAAMWRPLLERAPSDAQVHVVELADHGSQPDDPEAGWQALERDVDEALQAPGRPCVAVGLSLGSYLIARCLHRRSGQVERAVLFGGFARMSPELGAARGELAAAIESGQMSDAQVRETILAALLGPEQPPEHQAQVDAILSQFPRPRLIRAIRAAQQAAAPSPLVEPFDVPAVVVHEEQDPAIPRELGRELADLGRDARFVPLEGAGHFTPVTRPDEVARWVFASEG